MSTIPPISAQIRNRIQKDGEQFHAHDNIADYIKPGEMKLLEDELTEKFEAVLDTLIIDRHTDDNSQDTARRIAKMYLYETLVGRYTTMPKVTAFKNRTFGIVDDEDNDTSETVETLQYDGLQVVTAPIKSMCSHHHQPVSGIAYIGVLPDESYLGLSKFIRLAQWLSARGTLQEQLTQDLCELVMDQSDSEDVAVTIIARHGCCENRGVRIANSPVITTRLRGLFYNATLRKEFSDHVRLLHGQGTASVMM